MKIERQNLNKLIVSPFPRLFRYGIIILTVLFVWAIAPIQAESPVIRLGFWNSKKHKDCPKGTVDGYVYKVSRYSYDIDTFTRDALAGEMSADDHPEALKANAVMIRALAEYYSRHPESNSPIICNMSGEAFTLRTSKVAGWRHGKGATERGIGGKHVPNDRVTDTMGLVLYEAGQPLAREILFNLCLQNKSKALAASGLSYIQILTDPTNGLYTEDNMTDCGYPAKAALSNPTTRFAYTFRRSLTNGTSPHPISGARHDTTSVTQIPQARQAEAYWGQNGMNPAVLHRPWNQDGTYMKSSYVAGRVEYLMKFGYGYNPEPKRWGNFENLHLIGISDIPRDVLLNIYLDGYYQGTMKWTENDNRRHLRVDKISDISNSNRIILSDTHAIAIEFANDYCACNPHHPDTDRNFYIDVLGVNDGEIHERGMEAISPFFSSYELYLPLMIK